MKNYQNVDVEKLANIYFEGRVISRNITFRDGSTKTLGVMLKGEYEFNTEQKEIMEIMTGKLQVLLPNKSEWINIKSGEIFEVPKNSSFKLKIHELTNYCCEYIDE